MKTRTRVVVYGLSLNMAGIAASFKADASLEVICIDPNSPTARQTLDDLNPAAIAFDLSDPSTRLDLKLLHERPRLLFIGVDPSSDELLVLSGRTEQGLGVGDLVNVIRQNDNHLD